MEDHKKSFVALADEQLDALVQSLLPVMQEFFKSDRGKKIWAEHLEEIRQGKENVA